MQNINEPGIRRRKDGRFVVRATAKCPWTGIMLETRRTMPAGATLEESVAMRDSLKGALRQQNRPATYDESPQAELTTLADFCEWWIEQKADSRRLSTLSKYASVLGHHVLPHIGHLPMQRMTRHDIMQWTKIMSTKEKSPGQLYSHEYVRSCWRVLKTLLKDAHAWGYLHEDLTLRQDPPSTHRKGRQEKKTLTSSELRRYLEVFRDTYPDRFAEVLTLAHTGMRPGELYALRWEDVDLSGRCISVRRSVYRGEVNTTKTDAPREVPITSEVVEALEEHRRQQIANQHLGLREGIVFPADTGLWRYPSTIRKPMRIVARHLDEDQRVTPQVLRRTFITLLVASGIDLITIWSIVGHSSMAMTQRYSGVRMETKHSALSKLSSISDEDCQRADADLVEEAVGK